MVRQLVDLETGEQLTTWDILKEEGAKEVKKQEYLKTKRKKDKLNKFIEDNCGSFYFNFYNRFKKIDEQYLIRYLYLCTYMDFDSNILSIRDDKTNRKRRVIEKDLKNLWNISERETLYTKKELYKHDLMHYNKDTGELIINDHYCKKGKVRINRKVAMVRMFEVAIREIYENSKPTEHKKIGLLIKLLPYINLKYNIVCSNTDAETTQDIIPLNMKEIAEKVGYSNSTKLKRDLFALRCNGEKVIMLHEDDDGKFITVNPKVYYKGTDFESIDRISGWFDVTTKK